jgi:glycosyltransferase involved in cell wall biosynthesis
MQLSIIIPTKERDDIFGKTLLSAANATQHIEAEIIVVNDSKSSIPVIPESLKNVKLFDNPKTGVASARNLGAKNASGHLLLFLDNDILISRESINHIIMLHSQLEHAAINLNWIYSPEMQQVIGSKNFGRFLDAHRFTSFKGWYQHPTWQDNALFESLSVASFHLSISRRNFERAEGYAEQFPHSGFEDYDFPIRLKKCGITFYIDSRVSVYHNEIDRLGVENWLTNQERRSTTRKVAVSLGYKELKLHYGLVKRFILSTVNIFYPLHNYLLKIFPNYEFFDPLYFKWLSVIQAARIYKGYNSV